MDRATEIAREVASKVTFKGVDFSGLSTREQRDALTADIEAALRRYSNERLEAAAKACDESELKQQNDHGAANTGGAAEAADAVRSLKETP